jgi:hypothetical protein
MINPTAFISYAWENDEVKHWVKDLATQLRTDGIDAKLDQWEVVPGDQMPHFMEQSVRENNFVLIVCTPKYKSKSENRIGGVGYEGDIMTAEVLEGSNYRKFIPILKEGTKDTALPSWLKGKYYIDLSNKIHFENNYNDLKTTLLSSREVAPKLGKIKISDQKIISKSTVLEKEDSSIKIKGILVDEITQPLNDGSPGSALYTIPFELSRRPNYEWVELFINSWNRPTRHTSMHRSGIASVNGSKIVLDGTTIEEVERYHKYTLKLAVDAANDQLIEIGIRKKQIEEQKLRQEEGHRKNIDYINKRINFD